MVKTTATSATTYAAQRGVRGRKTLLKERVKLNDEKFVNGEGKKGLVLPVKTLKKYGEEETESLNDEVVKLTDDVWLCRAAMNVEDCDRLVRGAITAAASGAMDRSATGAGSDEGRTSKTLPLTGVVLQSNTELNNGMDAILRVMREFCSPFVNLSSVFVGEEGTLASDAMSKPSGPGSVRIELPQIARYGSGDFFKAHHDAFPSHVAASKGYQRIATLLIYLNDCESGGATRFLALDAADSPDDDDGGLAVRPVKGDALLFFPCGRTGSAEPDERAVHEAMPAFDEKWIAQVWLSTGIHTENSSSSPSSTSSSSSKPLSKAMRRRLKKKR